MDKDIGWYVVIFLIMFGHPVAALLLALLII